MYESISSLLRKPLDNHPRCSFCLEKQTNCPKKENYMLRYTVTVQFDAEPTETNLIQSKLDKLGTIGTVVETKAKSVKLPKAE